MSYPQLTKDPDAVLDYGFDWTAWLGSDTIVVSTWVLAAGLTEVSREILAGSKKTRIWISGGTAGTDYVITNRIVTTQGRTEDRSMTLRCEQR